MQESLKHHKIAILISIWVVILPTWDMYAGIQTENSPALNFPWSHKICCFHLIYLAPYFICMPVSGPKMAIVLGIINGVTIYMVF